MVKLDYETNDGYRYRINLSFIMYRNILYNVPFMMYKLNCTAFQTSLIRQPLSLSGSFFQFDIMLVEH